MTNFSYKTNLKKFQKAVDDYDEAQMKLSLDILNCEAEIAIAKEKLEELQKKQNRLLSPDWIEYLVKPIVDDLRAHYTEAEKIDVYGPMGLSCTVSINILRKDFPSPGKRTRIHLRPDFSQDKYCLGIVDYETNTNQYPPGSIGEENGMNYSTIPMFDTLEELIAYLDQ